MRRPAGTGWCLRDRHSGIGSPGGPASLPGRPGHRTTPDIADDSASRHGYLAGGSTALVGADVSGAGRHCDPKALCWPRAALSRKKLAWPTYQAVA